MYQIDCLYNEWRILRDGKPIAIFCGKEDAEFCKAAMEKRDYASRPRPGDELGPSMMRGLYREWAEAKAAERAGMIARYLEPSPPVSNSPLSADGLNIVLLASTEIAVNCYGDVITAFGNTPSAKVDNGVICVDGTFPCPDPRMLGSEVTVMAIGPNKTVRFKAIVRDILSIDRLARYISTGPIAVEPTMTMGVDPAQPGGDKTVVTVIYDSVMPSAESQAKECWKVNVAAYHAAGKAMDETLKKKMVDAVKELEVTEAQCCALCDVSLKGQESLATAHVDHGYVTLCRRCYDEAGNKVR